MDGNESKAARLPRYPALLGLQDLGLDVTFWECLYVLSGQDWTPQGIVDLVIAALREAERRDGPLPRCWLQLGAVVDELLHGDNATFRPAAQQYLQEQVEHMKLTADG